MKLGGLTIKKGYGFLSQEGKEDSDIFVHISAVKDSDVKRLEKGQIVEYDIQEQDNGKVLLQILKYFKKLQKSLKKFNLYIYFLILDQLKTIVLLLFIMIDVVYAS